jgi:hypothetical protein
MYTDDEAIVDSIEDLGLLFEIYRLADKVSKENIKKIIIFITIGNWYALEWVLLKEISLEDINP